ncbi:MAG: outer membrane lipoprotein-sorting protein [Novosphingobium sp.]|nr:outer membrane lipoprotein-sorting protein [Novosphingobium sp.]
MTDRLKIFLIAAIFFVVTGAAPEDRARAIMAEQQRRMEASSEIVLSTMVMRDKRGNQRTRRLLAQTVKDGAEKRSLVKFLAPSDIRNVGLLTWQRAGSGRDDQWLYLEASKQTKRIVGSSMKNAFMGTDLAYEDLRHEDLAAHDYKLVGEKAVGSARAWVIEAVPATAAERRNSGYAKRVLWVRQDNYVTVLTSFRDRRDREVKRATYTDLERISGDMWRANRTLVSTTRTGSSTEMTADKRRIGVTISDQVFLPQNIARQARFR